MAVTSLIQGKKQHDNGEPLDAPFTYQLQTWRLQWHRQRIGYYALMRELMFHKRVWFQMYGKRGRVTKRWVAMATANGLQFYKSFRHKSDAVNAVSEFYASNGFHPNHGGA